MKLKLLPPDPPPKEPALKNLPTGYKAGPVGWWSITTEGDCEGRSTRDLGIHFGHVAELAFSLPEGPMYSYRFSPVTSDMARSLRPGKRLTRKAVRKTVWVSFDYGSGLVSYTTVERWLNCPESITVHEKSDGVQYYNSVCLKLK